MTTINESLNYVTQLFGSYLVVDMDRPRADCIVRADPDDGQFYDEEINVATYYAERDADRIANVLAGLAYKRGGTVELTVLTNHIFILDNSDEVVDVEGSKIPASKAISRLLAAYDIDTNSQEVIGHAAKAFSNFFGELKEDVEEYQKHIFRLLDNEGGSLHDMEEREPFTEWLNNN